MRFQEVFAAIAIMIGSGLRGNLRAQSRAVSPRPIDVDPPEFFETSTDADAGDRYEIQVYGAATLTAGRMMVELHSNYTLDGFRTTDDGTLPDNHALHETLEITRGFSDWLEVGVYAFTSENPGAGFGYAGTSVRPRVRVPESWGWPIGIGLSQEASRLDPRYSADSWTYEFRPIIDRQIERWYITINPTIERSLRGPGLSRGFQLTPSANLGFDATARVNLALEYYATLGRVNRLLPSAQQEQQLFYAANLNLSPDYEINAGYGVGLDRAVEKRMIKLILGRRM